MPYGFTLTDVRASLTTAQSSGSIFTVDINEGGTSILSTKLTVDNGEKTSTTAATPAAISDAELADDAEITIDIDQIGDGTAKGLKVALIGQPRMTVFDPLRGSGGAAAGDSRPAAALSARRGPYLSRAPRARRPRRLVLAVACRTSGRKPRSSSSRGSDTPSTDHSNASPSTAPRLPEAGDGAAWRRRPVLPRHLARSSLDGVGFEYWQRRTPLAAARRRDTKQTSNQLVINFGTLMSRRLGSFEHAMGGPALASLDTNTSKLQQRQPMSDLAATTYTNAGILFRRCGRGVGVRRTATANTTAIILFGGGRGVSWPVRRS